jgi:hypothetical protein
MRLVLAASIAVIGLAASCGGGLFPRCDDPKHPCPNVEPDYPVSPPFGAQLETQCKDACAHLRSLGCPEGQGSLSGEPCPATCYRAAALRPLPLLCWTDAGSVADARACGSLRCAPR